MKKLLLTALLLTTLVVSHAQPELELDKVVRQVQAEEGMRHATLSVSLYDAATAERLYGYDDQRSVTPASVQKLLTTGTAFARLGGAFRFTTRLLMRGEVDRDGVLHGDLYIIGGGDPLLGSYRYRQTTPDTLFGQWTAALRSRGVQRVDGRVYYVNTLFAGPQQHDSWQHGDVGNYYGAGATGLNFHENMYFVYFNAGQTLGNVAKEMRTVPKNLSLQTLNMVTTGPKGSGDQVIAYGLPWFNERVYCGTVPLGARDFSVRIALPYPARTCADLFATYLRSHGVSVTYGAEEAFAEPDSVRTVSEYRSPVYRQIAQYTNHTSNNIYAEAIFKYLGYKQYNLGTFDNGTRAVEDYLKERGLETGGVRVVDGSGLSRLNSVTTDFLSRYLVAVSHESYFGDFLESLSAVGSSGTARNLLPALPNGMSVRLKTGSMDGVKSYAGYITLANGQRLAFAIIVNGYECTGREAGERMASILQKITILY